MVLLFVQHELIGALVVERKILTKYCRVLGVLWGINLLWYTGLPN